MMLIRSLLFNLAFMLWTYGLALVGLPTLLLPPRYGCFAVARLWGRGTVWLLRVLCGITHRIEGLEHVQAHPRCVIACKHQSAWDTAIFWTILPEPAYVLKRELLRIPLFGWYLQRLGNIAIDRSGGSKTMKVMLQHAQTIAAENRPIVIFPEGTRTVFGEKGEYQPGAAMLANQLQLPIVPAALNSGACWGRNAFLKTPGVITLRFLPALPETKSTRVLLQAIETSIETACAELPTAH